MVSAFETHNIGYMWWQASENYPWAAELGMIWWDTFVLRATLIRRVD